jgi:peptidyl-prolyl cis-trans isomerase B (cyclophilin B)
MRITVLLVIAVTLMPGCILAKTSDKDSNSDSTTIVMNIFHGETLEEATANFTITIELNRSAAPLHSANMLKHVEDGNYDMTYFHRIIDDFMIQGGDFENYDGTGGYAAEWYGYCDSQERENSTSCPQTSWTVPDEANNGLQHLGCTISMAKTQQPNSAGSQFFIMPGDIEHHEFLDGDYTVFGEVTHGCGSITTISEVATGQNDRPVVPVIILSAEIVD